MVKIQKKKQYSKNLPKSQAAPWNASARHWNPALPGFPMVLLVCQNSPSCTPKTGPKRTSSQPKKKPKDLNQGNAADVSWNGSTGKKTSTQQGTSLDLTLLYNKSLSCWSCSTFTCKQPGIPGFANPSKNLSCHAKFTAVREVQALNLKS